MNSSLRFFFFFLLGLRLSVCLSLANNRCIDSSFLYDGDNTIVISSNIDLGGKTISIPDGTVISFRGGSLNNGILSGAFSVVGLKKGSLNVKIDEKASIINCIPIFSNSSNCNGSIISACKNGCYLVEDIRINEPITLHSDIDGNGFSITSVLPCSRVLQVIDNSRTIVIKNIQITQPYVDGEIARRHVFYALNSSNIVFDNCVLNGRIYVVNKRQSDDDLSISKNYRFVDSVLNCDLSACVQDWKYEQDHITFLSIKDISIENCRINSLGVNRVLKTSAYFEKDIFDEPINCTDGISFRHNIITASCPCGKQLWDMFCGTVNVNIENNRFYASGFSEVFENKSVQLKKIGDAIIYSTIRIAYNYIDSKNSCLFQFHANTMCDSFIFEENEVHIGGCNENKVSKFVRTTGSYLQSYNSCIIKNNTFYWEDEAVGLMFATVNFNCKTTVISGNIMHDVYRVNFYSSGGVGVKADSFVYTDNVKYYSRLYSSPKIEIGLQGATIKKLIVRIPHDSNVGDDFYVSFNNSTHLDVFDFDVSNTKINEKAFVAISDKVRIRRMKTGHKVQRINKGWYFVR